MDEGYVLKCRVYAGVAWAVVALFFLGGWTVMLVDVPDRQLALGLFASGCMTSAVAATLHIRSFMVRIAAMMRRGGHLEDVPANLRPIGGDDRR